MTLRICRQLRAVSVFLLVVVVPSGCIKSIGGPRLSVEYFDPAQGLESAVAASTVTLQPGGDVRALNVDVEVYPTGDSAILVILKDGVTWESLVPVLGRPGVEHARRSFRGNSPLAPPVVEVQSEHERVPVPRSITATEIEGVNEGAPTPDHLYCVFPAEGDMSYARLHQVVVPTPETAERRYRLRLNWITLAPDDRIRQTVCGTASNRLDLTDPVATGHSLDSFARVYNLPPLAVGILGIVLIGGIGLIAGS
jgi:hypothetical protein